LTAAKGVIVISRALLVPLASQLYNLTHAFKIPAMFFDSEETKRKSSELEGRAARMRAAAQRK
jgi:hypothetical protein